MMQNKRGRRRNNGESKWKRKARNEKRESGGRKRRERRPDLVSLRRGVSQSVKEGEHPSDRE